MAQQHQKPHAPGAAPKQQNRQGVLDEELAEATGAKKSPLKPGEGLSTGIDTGAIQPGRTQGAHPTD